MPTATVFPKTRPKPSSGSGKLRSRVSPKRSTTSVSCTNGGDGVPEDKAEAVRWYGWLPSRVPVRSTTLGNMYNGGTGVLQDAAEAVNWYRLAAEQGLAGAQYNLGVMYNGGDGVPEDKAEAVNWYRLAAEQGFAEAQFYVGVMYDKGEGVPENDAEAVKWYRLAAEQGEKAEAQLRLGSMNYKGEGVTAKTMPRPSSGSGSQPNRGPLEAQLGLGILYQQGLRAYRKITCSLMPGTTLPGAQGNEQARDIKDDLRTRMTPDQIAQAQEMSATLFDRIN